MCPRVDVARAGRGCQDVVSVVFILTEKLLPKPLPKIAEGYAVAGSGGVIKPTLRDSEQVTKFLLTR